MTRIDSTKWFACLSAVSLLALAGGVGIGCSDDDSTTTTTDGGTDASGKTDASVGIDAGTDASNGMDAGTDAGVDASEGTDPDSGEDAPDAALSCGAGTTACEGACVDTQTDTANCGACGTQCPSGQVCSTGGCTLICSMGQTLCGGGDAGSSDAGALYCADTASDPANCGACGNSCPLDNVCSSGICTLGVPTVGVIDSLPSPLPDGLKAGCYGTTCPKVVTGRLTFYALSYGDNRSSYGLVGYGPDGVLVQGPTEIVGDRYVAAMKSNPADETVSIAGQSAVLSVPWSAFRLPVVN